MYMYIVYNYVLYTHQDDGASGDIIYEANGDGNNDESAESHHTEHRYAWRRRLSRDSVLQRLQDRSSSCNEESDEALARRLQVSRVVVSGLRSKLYIVHL